MSTRMPEGCVVGFLLRAAARAFLLRIRRMNVTSAPRRITPQMTPPIIAIFAVLDRPPDESDAAEAPAMEVPEDEPLGTVDDLYE